MKVFLMALVFTNAVLSGQAQASDSSALSFVGVSKDGAYAAFEEYGTQDGSGAAYSNITILDVNQNKHAVPAIYTREEDPKYDDGVGGTKSVRAKNRTKAEVILNRFKIVSPVLAQEKIRQVVARSPFEAHETVEKTSFLNRPLFGKSTHFVTHHELLLSTHPVPCSVETFLCDENNQQLGLKLDLKTLNGIDAETPVTKTLQNDRRVPRSRGYVYGYSIAEAYIVDPSSKDPTDAVDPAQSKIIVVLTMTNMGFEGASMGYLFVTGKMQ